MKFYTFEIAPNPRRVKLFMDYKGIDIDTVTIDLREKEQLKKDFLAINPAGTVPALVLDDDTV